MTESELPTEADRVSTRPVALGLAVALGMIALATLVVWLLVARDPRGGGRSDIVSLRIEPPADPFAMMTTHERRLAAQRAALDRWQWADPARHTVRLPIAVAIDLYLARRPR